MLDLKVSPLSVVGSVGPLQYNGEEVCIPSLPLSLVAGIARGCHIPQQTKFYSEANSKLLVQQRRESANLLICVEKRPLEANPVHSSSKPEVW